MTVVYTLTPELRVRLKEPFGTLIEGSPTETMSKLKVLVTNQRPARIISVGDVVSKNLHDFGFNPQLSIIDNISLRTKVMPEIAVAKNTIYVANPQGTITKEAISVIQNALQETEHVHIVVDGEEDLLVLITVLFASGGDFVVYGQPHVGIVVIRVSEEKQTQVQKLLNAMKPSKS